MNYIIDPKVFSAVFTVPAAVADKHLKLARGEHIKVLLYIMRNMSVNPDNAEIAAAAGLSEYEVEEALLYWAGAGILLPDGKSAEKAEIKAPAVKQNAKPDRADVARRGAEDEKIRYLLTETQMKLGRNLKSNESSTLVWLYDDLGLDVSLILMIVQYAAAHGKPRISFIESTATDWVNRGIDTIAEADRELNKMAMSEQAWGIVCSSFGLEKRKPSKNELKLSLIWTDEWKMSREMLTAAYNACVDSISKFDMKYVSKILENWHEKGYKTPDDIEEKKKSDNTESESFATYDLDLFEKMINSNLR